VGAGGPASSSAGGENARGDLARAIIDELRSQGRVDLDQVYERAERFRSVGMLADAHLLYFFSARQGHAQSALALGRMYDPKTFSREASILEQPDATQAHKWYQVAARAGDAAAKRGLADLRARVERAAGQGDDDARRLTLQWR
jgi:TPR repeat protein